METLIRDQWTVLGLFDTEHKIKLVVDEWGSWHPAGTEINPAHLFEQMSTLRDALVAALTLDTFNRHADKVDMANIAQLVNNIHSLFLADGDKFVATPNFHVFEMYRPHQGARSVRIDVRLARAGIRTGPVAQANLQGSRLGLTNRRSAVDADARAHTRHRSGRGRDLAPRRVGTRSAPDRAHTQRAERTQHVRAPRNGRADVQVHKSSRSRTAMRAGACLGDTA